MIHRRTYLRSASALTASVLIAGCSGDDDATDGPGNDATDGGSGPTESPEAGTAAGTPTGTPADGGSGTDANGSTAQSEYPDYNWDQLDGEDSTATTTVEIGGFTYDPLVARVPAGEEISFPNTDSAGHTVTAPALGIDETIESGGEATITFDETGTYDYVCRFHAPDMLGRVVVEEGVTVDGVSDDPDGGGGTDTDDGDDGGPAGPY